MGFELVEVDQKCLDFGQMEISRLKIKRPGFAISWNFTVVSKGDQDYHNVVSPAVSWDDLNWGIKFKLGWLGDYHQEDENHLAQEEDSDGSLEESEEEGSVVEAHGDVNRDDN